jgi:hypothetical protein
MPVNRFRMERFLLVWVGGAREQVRAELAALADGPA